MLSMDDKGRPITDQAKISLDSMKKTAASILDSLN
jgi:hypothetical protein